MQIDLGNCFHLSPVREGDQAAYLEHFAYAALVHSLLFVPFPYTARDADHWVKGCVNATPHQPAYGQFAIRRGDGFLVGGIGLFRGKGLAAHRAELGYWMARDYRNRGFARASVRATIQHGFDQMALKRIEALVDPANDASRHILETEGFQHEGTMRGYYEKNGELLDRCLYAVVRPSS